MSDPTIYRPHTRLVRIRIEGREFEVPENNLLLRCFQYIAPGIPYGPFCWNGDCDNDRLCASEGASRNPRSALACQTLVKEGMVIDQLSADLRRILADALKGSEGVPAGAPASPGLEGTGKVGDPHSSS